jgi:hypothetical protein
MDKGILVVHCAMCSVINVIVAKGIVSNPVSQPQNRGLSSSSFQYFVNIHVMLACGLHRLHAPLYHEASQIPFV